MYEAGKTKQIGRRARLPLVIASIAALILSVAATGPEAIAQTSTEAIQPSGTVGDEGNVTPSDPDTINQEPPQMVAAAAPPWSYTGEQMATSRIARCDTWKTPQGGTYSSSILRRGYWFDGATGDQPFGYDKARGKHWVWNRNIWKATVGNAGGCNESQSNPTAGVFTNWFDRLTCRVINSIPVDCSQWESKRVRSIEVRSTTQNTPPGSEMLGNLSIYCENTPPSDQLCPIWVGYAVPPHPDDTPPPYN